MTEIEFTRTLHGAFWETPATRATYFRDKAIEKGIDHSIFLKELRRVYRWENECVNSFMEEHLKIYFDDGTGWPKRNTIPVSNKYGGGKIVTNENITELWDALNEYEKLITAKESEPPEGKNKSFTWTGSQAQLEALCQALKTEYIHPDTTKEAFIAIFTGQPIDNNLSRVTWMKQGRNKLTSKIALIDLLSLMKIPKSEIEDNNKIKACFSDMTGIPITFSQGNLNGNKNNDHSECYPILKALIKSL